MNFIESISNYVLENFTVKDLPMIGMIALTENIQSESIYILAGMNENDNTFEILQYFNYSLSELKIVLPSKIESAKILTKYYLGKIVNNPDNAFEIMNKLNNEVYMQMNWDFKNCKREYIGEELYLEHLYTWYREIQDWNDGAKLLYYDNLTRNEQRIKFQENLVIEANKVLNKNY